MSSSIYKLLAFLILSFYTSCATKNETKENIEARKVKVAVVNYPLLFFAETIGQEDIEVLFPVPQDIDPAYWAPSTAHVAEYQSADIIFINGAGYAQWLENVSLPTSKIINTTSKVSDRYQKVESGPAHSHGPEGEHSHDQYAFTTWLDLSIAKSQAEVVYETFVKAMPEKEKEMSERYSILAEQLDVLHADLNEVLKRSDGFYGSHPVYQYLAFGYGVEIASVHWEPGEDLSEQQWLEFENLSTKSNIMLWEGQPTHETKLRLEDLGIESIVFTTCSSRPDSGDFISAMRSNINALSQ